MCLSVCVFLCICLSAFCPSICFSVSLPVLLSVSLVVYLTVNYWFLFVFLSVYPSISPSVCLSVCWSVYLSWTLSEYLFDWFLVCLSVRQLFVCISLPVNLPACPVVYLTVSLTDCVSVSLCLSTCLSVRTRNAFIKWFSPLPCRAKTCLLLSKRSAQLRQPKSGRSLSASYRTPGESHKGSATETVYQVESFNISGSQ